MTDNTLLGNRMKQHEHAFRHTLPRRAYTLMRLDGRSFHTYLRGSAKPFDMAFVTAMDEVAAAVCKEVSGTVFAYVQSDEISLLVTDFDRPETQAYFGGVVAKLLSVPASVASVQMYMRRGYQNRMFPQFDNRVWSMADPVEVANYFVWRQRDAVRNSIQMLGQHWFTQAELHGKNTDEVQEMLFQTHGVNWGKLDEGLKNGRVVVTDQLNPWLVVPAPKFAARPDNWLADMIPSLPSLLP
jgi:tRNA(His) 5'-end guanylyltransferase